MEDKYKKKLCRRVDYIVQKKGYDHLDKLVMSWSREFSEEHNHGRHMPDKYMELQLRFLYAKLAREYRREGGKLWQLMEARPL